MFTSFDASPDKFTSRAEAQAKYRERNKEAEREKARVRMRVRREEGKALARRVSQGSLRTSTVFARYTRHVKRHSIAIYGDAHDPEYVKGIERLNLKCCPADGHGLVENSFEREDVIFMIQRAQPERRASTPDNLEIESYVANLNRCKALTRFDWDEGKPHQSMWYIHSGDDNYNEDDLEFMFMHAVPTPTTENMDACGCYSNFLLGNIQEI
ncbi:hypothetical protein C8R47DRAFT_1210700 [Mycena vitilis]|nr:hypothetical protein C8R47DRAFT_1210700 [Mycena vitilis]